jgi:hypothetical protein
MKNIRVTATEAFKRYKPVKPDAHKGTQGHALLIGGSYGKMGAISLTTKAALKSGCGLVTAFIPKCGYGIVQIGVPEAMIFTDTHKNHISRIHYDIVPQAIGIGLESARKKKPKKHYSVSSKPIQHLWSSMPTRSIYCRLTQAGALYCSLKRYSRRIQKNSKGLLTWYSEAEKCRKPSTFLNNTTALSL